VSTWLSPAWFEETRTLWPDLPLPAGVSARIQCEISGGPEGSFSCYWVLEDGHLTDLAPGAVATPNVTLTLVWDDALAMHRGNLDPNVAFMQGRMKVAGSMAVMIGLLPLARTDAYRDVRRRVAALTDS
jgi:SCP-2 sterol transfer family protein